MNEVLGARRERVGVEEHLLKAMDLLCRESTSRYPLRQSDATGVQTSVPMCVMGTGDCRDVPVERLVEA